MRSGKLTTALETSGRHLLDEDGELHVRGRRVTLCPSLSAPWQTRRVDGKGIMIAALAASQTPFKALFQVQSSCFNPPRLAAPVNSHAATVVPYKIPVSHCKPHLGSGSTPMCRGGINPTVP